MAAIGEDLMKKEWSGLTALDVQSQAQFCLEIDHRSFTGQRMRREPQLTIGTADA